MTLYELMVELDVAIEHDRIGILGRPRLTNTDPRFGTSCSSMDIDPDISNWVLEFLLRQPLEDRTLNPLLRALPLSNNNHNLKKLLLLKKLDSEISQNSISESTLELLEQLEELEFQEGRTVSDAMKRGYCAVAVDCTVKHLANEGDGESVSKFKFFEAVKRVWRGRIGRMEKELENGGLGSEELWGWKDEIEAAVWDDTVCESVVKKSEGVNAVEAVDVYLREEREKMGPSFLELVADRVKDDEVLQGMLEARSVDAIKEAALGSVGRDTDISNGSREMQKGKIQRRSKLIGSRRLRGLASGNCRGAKIVDNDDAVGPSNRNYDLPRSAEVNRVREALESSSLELKAVVTDPLPDALQLAETMSGVARENNGQGHVEENHAEDNLFVVDGAGVVQATRSNMNNPTRPSLMERNSSAHAFEWDDSIDRSEEAPADGRRMLMLPSPRTINVSPLNRYEIKNLKKRRRPRKWSTLEEDTLRDGVQKYGKGNWKVILTENRDIFEDRTEVDLKDKWRNLTR
ncbi:hypothetical protein BUALT_Bualt13G0102200 [Buddleja alternifolia]|uniref:Uncharacterized protein n=1 Tax=Buddleja alternifolia TaxID=168488 RepID=A0AAV6WX50_9LAMI|nr:hypothetical protein BUALT_Bualt13G0102200 [Buddleja alternifolia]